MVRKLLSRPAAALLGLLLALMPLVARAAGTDPGAGQPFGVDWTPIVFWVIVGAVILGGFALGFLIDWGNR